MLCFRARDYNKVALGSTWVFVTAVADQLLRNFLSDIQQLVAEHLAVFRWKKEKDTLESCHCQNVLGKTIEAPPLLQFCKQSRTHAEQLGVPQSRNASDSIPIVGEKVG